MHGTFEKNDVKIFIKKFEEFYEFTPMFHSHMEIVYVLSGSINMTIDGISKKLEKGQASITFPYSVHNNERSEEAKGILVLFSPSSVDAFEKTLLAHKPKYPYINVDNNIRNLLCRMEELSKNHDETSVKTMTSYLSAVIGEVISNLNFIDDVSLDTDTTQKVLLYCAEHFSDDISINSISKDLYISKSSVTKVFSSKIKFSFREYINTLRVSKAKKLLTNSDKKIIEIMHECGFKNQSSFNRVFYKQSGMTPKDFRDNTIKQ